MDLALYGRVIWRFKFIVALGLVLACVLAVLTTAKITSHGLVYRKPVIWQSATTLMLTQTGFPEGRALFPPSKPDQTYPYADIGRFASLTQLYATFANSDAVRQLMRGLGAPSDATVSAQPLTSNQPGAALPVIALAGQADSPAKAVAAAQIGTKALVTYVTQQQDAAGIPQSQRVDVTTLAAASPPTVAVPRKKTLPIVVFVAVLAAALALAFVLENLRPRVSVVSSVAADLPPVAETRRTA